MRTTRSSIEGECRDSHIPGTNGCPRPCSRVKLDGMAHHHRKTRASQLTLALIFATLAAVILASHAPISAESQDAVATIRIGVLGLFHPHQLTVTVPLGQALILHATSEQLVLETSSGADSATLRLDNDSVIVTAGRRIIHAPSITITGRGTDPVDFLLSVAQKLTRHYRGTLEIRPSSGSLLAIVTMDRETAVASVLAAETTGGTPFEALKAEAIAIRSYFVAGRAHHHEFDFCDTTHCQFLREPPPPASAAAKAVAATHGLVLAYDSQPFAAMYSRSCSGRTRTPTELHLPSSNYPYYAVECHHCRAHPVRWTTRISAAAAPDLRPLDERARLNVVRRIGWGFVPSNDFTKTRDGDSFILSGVGQGHGIGLCQSGAKVMAQDGATFQQILGHYYPNTTVVAWPK
jgi:stage II sporulation protein D (peptidoglycan lytic transglycosylase)